VYCCEGLAEQPEEEHGARSWLVTGTNGENRLHAVGLSLAEAHWRACQQARVLGMLAPPREDTRR
jgi:hypothetical protein